MLKADVIKDYKNDWLKRCSSFNGIDYSALTSKKICWLADSNNPAFEVMSQIFDNISSKCKGLSISINKPFDECDLYLIWNFDGMQFKSSSLPESIRNKTEIIIVTDSIEKKVDNSVILYSDNIYGAGYNSSEALENNCTNILNLLSAQLFMIANIGNLKCGRYYAGHGKCTDIECVNLNELGYSPMISYDDGKFMADFALKRPDELFYFDNTYNGNLKLLHTLLLKCLLEFDRICKKHNIKYFLGGGTLLGAVRHNGMIPWDDDMDVMMLREDYEKFLSVVNGEICDEMFFQSSRTDNQYHSIFTKIRLNGTKFITQYSNQFENMHQGIFIDIFVHDHTSNNKIGQKLHIFKTLFARSLVFHKWAGTPMHFYGKLKFICKFATKFMNNSSMEKLEKIQDNVVQKYNKKHTKYLYDGTGEHLKHGAFPAFWLDETVYANFCGHEFPIPKYYDEYLEYSYRNYNELIPASLRKAGHNIIEVDFGKYKQ